MGIVRAIVGRKRFFACSALMGIVLLAIIFLGGVRPWNKSAAGVLGHSAAGISSVEARQFAKIGLSDEGIAALQNEIRLHGKDARGLLLAALERNRVLGMGETHDGTSPHRRFGELLMREFKRAGATHLAVELPMEEQRTIDEFVATGRLEIAQLPYIVVHQNYISLLRAARDADLRIVCVDTRNQSRDQHMAARIGKILDANPDHKVIFWVGSNHLRRPVAGGQSARESVESAAQIIAKRFTMATVMDQSEQCHRRGPGFYPISVLATHQAEPIAFEMQHTPRLSELPVFRASTGMRYADWDIVVAYPGKR